MENAGQPAPGVRSLTILRASASTSGPGACLRLLQGNHSGPFHQRPCWGPPALRAQGMGHSHLAQPQPHRHPPGWQGKPSVGPALDATRPHPGPFPLQVLKPGTRFGVPVPSWKSPPGKRPPLPSSVARKGLNTPRCPGGPWPFPLGSQNQSLWCRNCSRAWAARREAAAPRTRSPAAGMGLQPV